MPDPRAIAPPTTAAVPVCSRTQRGGFRAPPLRAPAALAGPASDALSFGHGRMEAWPLLDAWPTPRAGAQGAEEGTRKRG
jgi:hypothetical protein